MKSVQKAFSYFINIHLDYKLEFIFFSQINHYFVLISNTWLRNEEIPSEKKKNPEDQWSCERSPDLAIK